MYLLKLQQLKPSIYDVKVVSSFSVLGWMKSPVLWSSIVQYCGAGGSGQDEQEWSPDET